MIADLQPPDVETRIAIFRKKSEDEGIKLPEDVIQFLSGALKSNIRELEGSLVRLGAYVSLTGQIITLDMAKNVLRDLIGDKKKIVAMEDIQEAVCTQFHVKMTELKSRRRSKTLVHPRQIAMYLCRELTDASYPEIGRQFGGKDHTTIIHACRQVSKSKETDTALQTTLETLKEHIVLRDTLKRTVERGATVFLTSHVLEIVEKLCTHVGIIAQGKLVHQGPMAELRISGSLEEHFLEVVGADQLERR